TAPTRPATYSAKFLQKIVRSKRLTEARAARRAISSAQAVTIFLAAKGASVRQLVLNSCPFLSAHTRRQFPSAIRGQTPNSDLLSFRVCPHNSRFSVLIASRAAATAAASGATTATEARIGRRMYD